MKICNWCTENFDFKLKPYCNKCKQHMYKECIRCHRPLNDIKYFTLNNKRCNACQRKYLKEKKANEIKKEKKAMRLN
jgi:hypothetical protein